MSAHRQTGRRLGLAASISLAVASFALAAATPALAAPKCTSNASFLIVEVPHGEDVGNTYLVRDNTASPKPVCSTKKLKTDLVIGSRDDAFYLLKLVGNYFLIDAGTGPDRDLLIYDLASKKEVFSGGYSDDDIKIDSAKAVFWTGSAEKPTKKNCKDLASIQKNGLTPVIEQLVTFDFTSGTLTKSNSLRCSAEQ
ncbi:hypothetical protein SAMN02745157_0916 [Kaistia soli DSM 19436]|uniref:Uncharacterized protein n=1 Tax=Kaistia soli DSM 19436 TaxID=1122133 RepID=A0A1M4W9H2_9HYPH|nr:hypothetical protein [Kaistia soli]SHE77815.1 hypothetical protein SAMN02745157_0916 [Kaistia soli DSM 19436]